MGLENDMNERGIEQQMEIKVTNIAGWWYTYPSEQYESQLGWFFPIYGKYWKVIKFMFQTTNQIGILAKTIHGQK